MDYFVNMTQKQKALAKKILKNPSLTMKDAMLEVGYAPNTAIAPQNVTESKGWAELMEKYLPDEKLLDVHEQGLEAMKPIGALVLVRNGKDGKPEQILKDNEGMIEVPDHATRAKYLELGYKVKKKLGNEGGNGPLVQVNTIIASKKDTYAI